MKYMTYDLLARTRSEDDQVAENAAQEWELACDEYNKHVEAIRSKLPIPLHRILDDFCLHDASLVTLGKDETSLFLVVQLKSPLNQGLRLCYRFEQLKVISHSEHRKGNAEMFWLYDEIDVVETALPDGGRVSVFTHSILFNTGIELQIRFLGFDLKPYENILNSVKNNCRDGIGERERQFA